LGAAERLQSSRPAALFLLVGDGPRLADVEREARERRLGNVRFLPLQPAAGLGAALAAADVHLVCMREAVLGLVVPSKVYGVLAAGRPCIFLGPRECEAARLLERLGCGAVLPSTDAAGLAGCLHRWLERPDELEQLRRRAAAARGAVGLAAVLPAFEEALKS
jgi:colanic acid biosynthesis glycosyl transferase WcaI